MRVSAVLSNDSKHTLHNTRPVFVCGRKHFVPTFAGKVSPPSGSVANPSPLGCVYKRYLFPVEFNPNCVPPVSVLLVLRGPTHVAGFVVAVRVYAVKRVVFGRGVSDVSVEG